METAVVKVDDRGVRDVGACAAEAQAVPALAGEVLCFKLGNAVHIEAKKSQGFSWSPNISGTDWPPASDSAGLFKTTSSITVSSEPTGNPSPLYWVKQP